MPSDTDLLAAVDRAERQGTEAQLGNALDHLAAHYHQRGDHVRAVPVYGRAAALWQQILGPTHPAVGTLLLSFSDSLAGLGRLDDAERTLKQGLSICQADPDWDDPGTADVILRLVDAFEQAGRAEHAGAWRQRLVAAQVSVPVKAR